MAVKLVMMEQLVTVVWLGIIKTPLINVLFAPLILLQSVVPPQVAQAVAQENSLLQVLMLVTVIFKGLNYPIKFSSNRLYHPL